MSSGGVLPSTILRRRPGLLRSEYARLGESGGGGAMTGITSFGPISTHARLREIMLLASARIKRQALGHQDYELLKNMREALIESRAVARRFEKRKPATQEYERSDEQR